MKFDLTLAPPGLVALGGLGVQGLTPLATNGRPLRGFAMMTVAPGRG